MQTTTDKSPNSRIIPAWTVAKISPNNEYCIENTEGMLDASLKMMAKGMMRALINKFKLFLFSFFKNKVTCRKGLALG